MARPVWAGNLSFGLVSQPEGLYTATDSHTIHFPQLQGGTSDRIRNRRVNERTGDEVELEDIVKDYDADGEYFPVEPKELYEIAPVRSRSLEITGFVELAEVDPIFFDKTYHLGPRGAEFGKVYSLLEQALAKAGKEGIATFVMRQHEYLVALKAENGPRRVHDTFQQEVAALIEAKKVGETVEKAEPAAEPTGVVDLMEALRASVERPGSPKATASGKASVSSKATAKRPPPRTSPAGHRRLATTW
ncbi:non-homologous end joining protein Ku [Streptomyces goshikiensis]